MAKRSAIRVALDLETTGLHPEQDAILEIAAVKFQGTEIIDTLETFVAPGRSIPYRVQRLTGIKPEHLIGAPPFSAVANKLQHFLGDFPIVGHSIPFDAGFLRMRGIARSNPLIDTFELATVLLPSLVSYNLGQVAEALGVRVPHDRHRAMVDTVLAMEVFNALHQRLQAVDLDVLNDLANLDAPRSWPLLHFFRQELRDRQEREGVMGRLSRGSLGDRFASQLGMDPRVLSFAVGRQQDAGPSSHGPAAAVAPVADVPAETPLVRGNEVARQAILTSLEQRDPLLLELTLGGHDYTAALLAVLEWLAENPSSEDEPQAGPRRLVIACANQQSARRLIDTTLPLLQQKMRSDLSVAYLAEHGGYLCTHRWFGAAMRRTSGELTAEQARGLAKLRLWTHETLQGDRSELTLLQQEITAWDRISSGFEQKRSVDERFEKTYQRCTYRRKGYCFVSLAEERVREARIVVTTHAGLFDDLSLKQPLLASIDRRLILDADLIEEENIRWGGSEFDQLQVLRVLNTIGAELADGRYQGLLALAAPSLRDNGPGGLSTTPTVPKSELDQRLLQWFQVLRQARMAVGRLFLAFTSLVDEAAQQNGRDKGRSDGAHRAHGRGHERVDQPLRLTSHMRQLSVWNEVEQAWQQASQRLRSVIELANDAERRILSKQNNRRRQDQGSGEDTSVASELVAAAYQLTEYLQMVQQAISLDESDSVYWLRMPPAPPTAAQQHGARKVSEPGSSAISIEPAPILYSQLIHTSGMLKQLLLKERASTIFAGTAFSVDGSFSFARQRLGLDQDSVAVCSAVSEHQEQTLLYLPNDVPEPNAPQYQRHLDEALVNLATALEGQVVALFTSHAALRSTYTAIKPILEARNILVLGQGADGSPRQLWQVFQSQERVVILGTGSFWDNADEIVRSPACLFIARLPMPVLNDPPIAARAEQYSDQLRQLTVPMATLRVNRAIDRFMWGEGKRNAVVLFDRRVTSKEYGSTVLHSLPRCSQRHAAVSLMPDAILDWLTGEGVWETDCP
ncbi:exonuclease domain-containing protein [Dictyobacter formicarum]|uniref:DNA polymerase III subunit epsilon n=1 Tax=Dictyobacter formicarum TaxID=2778368 RepID=A0ABQ3VP33_9CHLR|nr:exonuclease domain-containing protein [Dictyobacter formicarum]GHO88007.1 DNA polymerase III subunit epsilon [Dictyobacter formicarum]